MATLEEIKDNIKKHENDPLRLGTGGLRAVKVLRQDGSKEKVWTGGFGHIMTTAQADKYKDKDIPIEVADKWFDEDFPKAYKAAQQQAKQLKAPSLVGALASVNFQLGTSWNKKFTNTWGMMTGGKWKSAGAEVLQNSAGDGPSPWFSQTKERALEFSNALIQKGSVPAGKLRPVKKP